VAALRNSLCVVARAAAAELAGEGAAALSLPRRCELSNLAAAWGEEGADGGAHLQFWPAGRRAAAGPDRRRRAPGRPRGEVARAAAAARVRAKDAEAARASEAELAEAAEYVAAAALAAAAALLLARPAPRPAAAPRIEWGPTERAARAGPVAGPGRKAGVGPRVRLD